MKEIKSAFDGFSISSEEKNEYLDNRKKEESVQDFRSTEELKSRDRYKESRSTRDETDTWAYIAAEGDHDAIEDCSGKKYFDVTAESKC